MTISGVAKNLISAIGLVAGGRVRLAVHVFKSLTRNSKRATEIHPPRYSFENSYHLPLPRYLSVIEIKTRNGNGKARGRLSFKNTATR